MQDIIPRSADSLFKKHVPRSFSTIERFPKVQFLFQPLPPPPSKNSTERNNLPGIVGCKRGIGRGRNTKRREDLAIVAKSLAKKRDLFPSLLPPLVRWFARNLYAARVENRYLLIYAPPREFNILGASGSACRQPRSLFSAVERARKKEGRERVGQTKRNEGRKGEGEWNGKR